MALYSSTWLRETARLYLRYMAVAAASIPFSVAAVWASRTGWHDRLVLSSTLISGLATAFVIWKWLGDWQLKPRLALSPFETEWANLLNATVGSGELLQHRLTLDENGCSGMVGRKDAEVAFAAHQCRHWCRGIVLFYLQDCPLGGREGHVLPGGGRR